MKKYFHELTLGEFSKIKREYVEKMWDEIAELYPRPNWCSHENAIGFSEDYEQYLENFDEYNGPCEALMMHKMKDKYDPTGESSCSTCTFFIEPESRDLVHYSNISGIPVCLSSLFDDADDSLESRFLTQSRNNITCSNCILIYDAMEKNK